MRTALLWRRCSIRADDFGLRARRFRASDGGDSRSRRDLTTIVDSVGFGYTAGASAEFSTARERALPGRRSSDQPDRVNTILTYSLALGEARSCLAALADSAADVEESVYCDRLLIKLDWITRDIGPATYPITASKAELLDRLEAAVDRLIDIGADGLSLELLLADARLVGEAADHRRGTMSCRSSQVACYAPPRTRTQSSSNESGTTREEPNMTAELALVEVDPPAQNSRHRATRSLEQLKLEHESLLPPRLLPGDVRWGLGERVVYGEGADSLLIQADARDGLARLLNAGEGLPMAGQIKLCYLDPPYNTGERFEHYDDRMDSAEWLATLRGHLELAKQLLSPDGSLWLHLDDSEQHRARCVLDEVFGVGAFVATIIWQKRTTRDNRKAFSSMHDYIHVYAPAGPKAWKSVRNGLPDEGAFGNPDNDPRGPWRSVPMSVQAGHATVSQFYTVTTPTGVRHDPPPGRCWTYTAPRLAELDADGRVYWPRGGDGKPRLKRYQTEVTGLAPFTIWPADEVGDTGSAKRALLSEFPDRQPFDTPKPVALLERIIGVATDPGDTVLDYYLGSGTTAVAAQSMGRPWIGIERSARTVTEFALPRVRNAWAATPGAGVALAHL